MRDPDRRGLSLCSRLRRLWNGDPSAAELASGLALILWGLSLAVPGGTFDARPEYYEQMAAIAPEMAWSGIMTLMGAGQVWVATIQNRRVPFARQALAFMSLLIWVFISATVAMRWPPSSGSMPHVVLALGAFWAFARAGERPYGTS